MAHVFEALKGKQEEMDQKILVTSSPKTRDYIISIPHAGTLVPEPFVEHFNLGRAVLIGSDLHTEEVYRMKKGITVTTKLNSYFVNMNRPREASKDPKQPKHLQQDPLHGLSLTGEPILIKEYTQAQREEILAYYDQYHQFLNQSIETMKKERGYALLFDCHSMNSTGLKNTPDEGKERPDFVVGSVDDTSAHPALITVFYETLREEAMKYGWAVKKNDPYKGGFITQSYGKPQQRMHALQLELKKANYMHEGLGEPSTQDFTIKKEGLEKVRSVVTKAIEATTEVARRIKLV